MYPASVWVARLLNRWSWKFQVWKYIANIWRFVVCSLHLNDVCNFNFCISVFSELLQKGYVDHRWEVLVIVQANVRPVHNKTMLTLQTTSNSNKNRQKIKQMFEPGSYICAWMLVPLYGWDRLEGCIAKWLNGWISCKMVRTDASKSDTFDKKIVL